MRQGTPSGWGIASKAFYRIRQFFEFVILGSSETRAHWLRQLRAKVVVFLKTGPAFAEKPGEWQLDKLRRPSTKIKIGISHSGTLGDKINLSRFLSAVKQRYPQSEVYIFDNRSTFKFVFDRNPGVDGFFVLREYGLAKAISFLTKCDYLDVFFENRYVVKAHFSPNSKIKIEEQRQFELAFAPLDSLFNSVPHEAYRVLDYTKEHGLNEWGIMEKSSTLPVVASAPFIPLLDEDFVSIRALIGTDRYVTVHHGAFIPGHLRGTFHQQTKNWFTAQWSQVVEELLSMGFKVYQIGLANEEAIPNADQTFMGKLNFHEIGALLSRARLHLDTEGGMVHLAAAMGTRAMVLFGPTPVHFFGYERNLNITADACRPCCWTTPEWTHKCPLGYQTPICMNGVTPQLILRILRASLETAADSPRPTPKLREG